MKNYALGFITLFSLVLGTQAFAEIRSINDIPQHWTGVVGDLIHQYPSTFDITKVNSVDRSADGKSIVYSVQAQMNISGQRVLKINKIQFYISEEFTNRMEAFFVYDDQLAYSSHVSFFYDEASNLFTLKDLVKGGMRSFIFTGKK